MRRLWLVSGLMLLAGAAVAEDNTPEVTIQVFSDFQCPFCKQFAQPVRDIESKCVDGVRAKVDFKNFPFSFHPFAQLAAEAALAVGEQGKSWDTHDLSFANQAVPKHLADAARNAKRPGMPARADVSPRPAVPALPCLSGREFASRPRGFYANPPHLPPSHSTGQSVDSRRADRIVRRCDVAGCGLACVRYWLPISPRLGDISQTELDLQIVKSDKLAARDLRLTFPNCCPIRFAQRRIAAAFRQKMQESAGEWPVGLRDHVNQTMEFFIGAHVSIVYRRAAV